MFRCCSRAQILAKLRADKPITNGTPPPETRRAMCTNRPILPCKVIVLYISSSFCPPQLQLPCPLQLQPRAEEIPMLFRQTQQSIPSLHNGLVDQRQRLKETAFQAARPPATEP